MLDVRGAAAKFLLFVVVVMAWHAMPLRLLKLTAGLGRAVPRGCRLSPGGGTRPRANHRPRVDDGRDPAGVRWMQPLEGVDLEGHAVACRSPRGVDYHAREVVSRVAHATPGLVAQCELELELIQSHMAQKPVLRGEVGCVESVALRYGMIKPGFVLPHSTPKGPVPRENGGGAGAIPRASTDDSLNIRDDVAQCPEDGHVVSKLRISGFERIV